MEDIEFITFFFFFLEIYTAQENERWELKK